jgi:uncharacterized protein YegJ (DUF2314 family)
LTRFTVLVVVLALGISGCSKSHPIDKVTHVADSDPRMNAAIDKAKSTVNTFIVHLKSPKPGETGFAIKTMFTEGAQKEHMWLSPVTFDGKNFQGIINNDPEAVTNVKIGQRVTVSPASISDWMYLDNRKLVGGYTLRVLRDMSSPAERAEFDKSVPFIIE